MLSYEELLGHVRQLTPEERLALIEATTQMIKEDLRPQTRDNLSSAELATTKLNLLKPVEELRGSLNPQGRSFTDEELDELKFSYLAEKYGLK